MAVGTFQWVPVEASVFAVPDTTMRAAVLTGPRSFELRDVATPECGPKQVLVRVDGCGVCNANVPVWEGRPTFRYPSEPGAPGHEGWGVVAQTGALVSNVVRGDRVAFVSSHAFAEYDVVESDALVRLPASLGALAFPGEAFGCAFNVWARSEIRSGHYVAVVGAGFLGSLLIRLAKSAGAHVVALSHRPYSLELARRMGADMQIDFEDPEARDAVLEFSRGAGCERVIEATGRQEPLDLASSLVATRGRLIIAGYHEDGLRQVDMQSWNWRGIDVINAHERDDQVYVRGIGAAAAAIARGTLDPSALVTHSFGLEELGDALEHARLRPPGFVKAVVRMHDRESGRRAG